MEDDDDDGGGLRDAFVHEDDVAYAGTVVTRGKGLGVVVATGGHTALGRVLAGVRRAKPPKTELQVGECGWRMGGWWLWLKRIPIHTPQPNTTINRNS